MYNKSETLSSSNIYYASKQQLHLYFVCSRRVKHLHDVCLMHSSDPAATFLPGQTEGVVGDPQRVVPGDDLQTLHDPWHTLKEEEEIPARVTVTAQRWGRSDYDEETNPYIVDHRWQWFGHSCNLSKMSTRQTNYTKNGGPIKVIRSTFISVVLL